MEDWATHVLCNACWAAENPGRDPDGSRVMSACCRCGQMTMTGIVTRAKISAMPYCTMPEARRNGQKV